MSAPQISVVIICFNEQENIADLLTSLADQTIGPDSFEVILVDNQSTDETIAIAEQFSSRFCDFRILVNEVRNIARSRNIGWQNAKSAFVAYTDADCIVPPDWLEKLLGGFSSDLSQRLVAVGGGNTPQQNGSQWMKSLGITLNSFWGSHGSTQGMLFEADRLVPHIPTLNIMYRKKALEQESGFDENFLRVCEDPELNFRLTEAGGEILFKHDASVIHKMRPTLKSWFRNVELYGFGRIEILKKHPSHLRLMWLVPIALVLGLTASIALATVWPVAALIPCGYFAFVLLLATQLCAKAGELSCIPMVFAVLSWNPIAYGWGQIRSLLGRPVQF